MIFQAIPMGRILVGIIIECVVFTVCISITSMILSRYRKSKNAQQRSMAMFYILYGLAILGSITGKILTYIYAEKFGTYDLDKTEWGLFTNWSFSLGFITFSLYYQLQVSFQLFPPKMKSDKAHLFTKIVTGSLILIIFAIPRYGIQGMELKLLYSIKFLLIFVYVLSVSLYYMIKSYKVYTFIRNKFLQRRILFGLIFHASVILVFVFFMVSSIYGAATTIYYSWGYFLSITFMMIAAVSGFLSVLHGKESDRQEIDEELQKLLKDRKIC